MFTQEKQNEEYKQKNQYQFAKSVEKKRMELICYSLERHNSGNSMYRHSSQQRQDLEKKHSDTQSMRFDKKEANLRENILAASSSELQLVTILHQEDASSIKPQDNDMETSVPPHLFIDEDENDVPTVPESNTAEKIKQEEHERIQRLINPTNFIDIAHTTFVELLSLADFITDIIVLIMFIQIRHQAWASITLAFFFLFYFILF
ncbi:hypothetical protein RFI_07086 [Reticulomyxa filosa]|uniref:Uncharacterized protein n=1 Tax=Reticulomyxa filosa TaxID=46433 RepID=X6NVW6_RETFI|nr:hypothetical protein RFI_07086 [Reticulomyxa filosa]|eukprot:ETO30033.1 hypothetical protein RFI_07086 [Reticulomyxa filosa]